MFHINKINIENLYLQDDKKLDEILEAIKAINDTKFDELIKKLRTIKKDVRNTPTD